MESVPQLTPREYLEWERTQEGKNEYWDGSVYAMSGASGPGPGRRHRRGAASSPARLR